MFLVFLALGVLTLIVAGMTLAPLLPIAHGAVRACEFPRLQIMAVTALLAVVDLFLLPDPLAIGLLVVQSAVLLAQGYVCLRYTRLWQVQSLPFDGAGAAVFRMVAANVKMSNRRYDALIDLLADQDPDMVILVEVDAAWLAALAPIRERYPFVIEQPQDNAYGMALFSRLPLTDAAVRFRLMEEVPSIRASVETPDGQRFALYVIHPEPPVPHADTLGRDGELILTAEDTKEDDLPAVVAGDLNDGAWSRSTRRFQRLSGLLDPRVGRGFFNSFDARNRFMRWPLDHLFHDARFRVADLARLPAIGSDHFPMLFALALMADEASGETPEAADADDVQEAAEVVAEAKTLDRKPIGSDWEN
ncbi:MAG: endonuclease/exonuclease/phosphatase family protein [Bauldia litoralis]